MSESDDLERRIQELEIENRRLTTTVSHLERSYDITLQTLGDALDLKNAETEGHSKRVTAFTIAMAKHMGLNDKEIRVIARGAFLHDIGKMAIPDAIMRKPGKLTEEETGIMQEHCLRGYQMIKKIPFLAEAAEIVYAHHERYEGNGYPLGLKGAEIPLGARLVAVTNSLDAITSDLPYRRAQTFDAALKEIELCSGSQFDPQIVKVFLDMPAKVWDDLRKSV